MPEDLMEPLKESLIEFGAKRERARIRREQAGHIDFLRRLGYYEMADRLEEATRDE